VQPPIQAWARKKGWLDEEGNPRIQYEEKYHNKVFNAAMKHTPSKKELDFAGLSFADLAQKGGMGGDFFPGMGFWDEITTAPQDAREAYHAGMQKIFFRTNAEGRTSHAILDDAGVPNSVTPRTTASYKGDTNPGFYVELLLPEDSFGVIDAAILQRLRTSISAIGNASTQEGIGYYKMVDAPIQESDMYHVGIGRTLTDAETVRLETALNNTGMKHNVVAINRPDGVDIYYTDFDGKRIIDKDKFVSSMESAVNKFEWDDSVQFIGNFGRYKGEYFDYKSLGPTGKGYKHGSDRKAHWENLANQSGKGQESQQLYSVYEKPVKDLQARIAGEFRLPDPNFRFRHLEKPQHPLSIEESLRGGMQAQGRGGMQGGLLSGN
jgi:hypothetical protein